MIYDAFIISFNKSDPKNPIRTCFGSVLLDGTMTVKQKEDSILKTLKRIFKQDNKDDYSFIKDGKHWFVTKSNVERIELVLKEEK